MNNPFFHYDRSTHKYWQITAADSIYPQPYAENKVSVFYTNFLSF